MTPRSSPNCTPSVPRKRRAATGEHCADCEVMSRALEDITIKTIDTDGKYISLLNTSEKVKYAFTYFLQ